MSVIILPSKWTRQPPGHAELDHSNYFGNLAVAAFLPGEPSPWAGTYGREPRPQGVFASFDGSTNGTVVQKSINAYPFSYVAQAYVSNLTATNTIIGMGSATAHTYALLDLSGTEAGDPFRLIIGAGALNSKLYKFSSSGHTSVVRTFVCVFESATVFRLYIDGAEVSNTATAGDGLQGLANLTHFGVGSYKSDAGDYTNKLTGGASVGAMFPVGFDASMAREISRNPWQMFRRVPQVLYFNAGGGATTVLTGQALTASVGDIAVVGEANVALSGQSVTVDYGSIVVEGHAAVDLGGQEVAVSLGTITFTAATGTRPYLQLAFDPTPAGVNLPPPPLEINWGHPFAKDLYRAFVVVGKELIDLVGGSSQAIDVSGVTSLGDGVYSNSNVALYPPVQPYPNSASFTAFTSYTPADAGTVNHILWYSSSTTSGNGFGNTSFAIREAHFGVSNTAGQGYAFVSQFGTIAATTDCMAYTSLDPVPGTAVLLTGVSRAAAANELYINGDQVGVSGATQTDSAPNFTYNYVNNVADTAITNQFMRGSTPFLFVFSREFSEEEVLYLNRTYRQLVRSKLLNIVGSAASAVVALSGQAVASAYGTLAPGSISSISSDDVVVYGETSAAISGFGFTGKATLTFTSGAASQVQGSLSVATDTSATFNITQGNLPYGSIDVTFS